MPGIIRNARRYAIDNKQIAHLLSLIFNAFFACIGKPLFPTIRKSYRNIRWRLLCVRRTLNVGAPHLNNLWLNLNGIMFVLYAELVKYI